MAKQKIRADMILRQIAKRHNGRVPDAFFTEVKNGSTWFNDNLLRLDAVAFKKSWKNPCITGYEIKVDRQDFMRDDKWPGYRQYCHRFYFACPTGLIAPDELPSDVGLIYYNLEKDCIHTKRKAAFRAIEISWEMLYYLVISRLDSDQHPFFSSRREMLKVWVEDKAERRELGWMVGNKMVEQITELEKQVHKLKRELEWQKVDIERLKAIEKILEENGIRNFHLLEDLKKALSQGVPPNMAESLERINKEVNQLMQAVGKGA